MHASKIMADDLLVATSSPILPTQISTQQPCLQHRGYAGAAPGRFGIITGAMAYVSLPTVRNALALLLLVQF